MAKTFLARTALVVFGVVLMLLLLEFVARAGIGLHLLQYDPPMMTMLPKGTADWRDAHITADDLRERDPVLWWRPKSPPCNAQGFKGPVVKIPKPANTVRIITYGDSNTEGTVQSSWPDRLQAHLNQLSSETHRKYEVLNAGVAGYSSHQGLLRFRQEVEHYQPDLVLVAFGWNDLASAEAPDKSYKAPHPLMVQMERILLRLKSYLVATHYARTFFHKRSGKLEPRVSKQDYIAIIRQFQKVGRRHRVAVVYLTRPHRETPEELLVLHRNFRSRVPIYNEELLKQNHRYVDYVIDTQGFFQPKKDLFADECHFTEKGQDIMAEYLAFNLLKLNLLEPQSPQRAQRKRK